MYRNHLLIALRHFWKNKVLTAINIIGLAIGISACLTIYLLVSYDFSFENFHADKEKIYRIVSRMDFTDLTIYNGGAPVPTADAAREKIPGLAAISSIIIPGEMKVRIQNPASGKDGSFRKQKNILCADSNYFNIIQYKWLAGSKPGNLGRPFQVVLSEKRAKQYFPALQPSEMIGKEIIYDDSLRLNVTGIVRDLEGNTDFNFKEFISRPTVEATGLKTHWNWNEWGSINGNAQIMVKLKSGVSPKTIEKQLAALRNQHRDKSSAEKDDLTHYLQPLADIHFNKDYEAFGNRKAYKPTLFGLMAVGVFLLILGCINFINLSTAQATTRAKEIGIRKTLGGGRKQLIFQFLSETFLLTVMATLISILILPWVLRIFGDFIPPEITIESLNQWRVWTFLLLLVVTVSLLSGYYPAIILSRFQPVAVLKGYTGMGKGGEGKQWLRKTLTITQFMIAQFLLVATLVVSKQLYYSMHKEMGFDQNAIVSFEVPFDFYSTQKDDRRFILQEKLNSTPEIEKTSVSGTPPASNNTSSTTITYRNGKKELVTMVEVKYADSTYFSIYGMKVLAGRLPSVSDTTKEFLINETYAKFLGFKDPNEAIGKLLDRGSPIPIVGVMADFHTKSTHSSIKPLAYSWAKENSFELHLKLMNRSGDQETWKRALSKTEKAFREIYPEADFNYTFFDESIAAFYKSEQQIAGLLKWSAALCLLISSLGLFGLVIHTTNARTKEIGVRKVLGATISQIVYLLSKDFLTLVLIAFIVITPLAYWVMKQWLQDFAYRTPLSWWLFLISGAAMLLVALITLSFRTIRSASENPVNSLRAE